MRVRPALGRGVVLALVATVGLGVADTPVAIASQQVSHSETGLGDTSARATASYLSALAASVSTDEVSREAVDFYSSLHGVDSATAARNLAIQTAFATFKLRIADIAGDALSSTWTHHGEVPVLEVRLRAHSNDPAMAEALAEVSPLIVVTNGVDEAAAQHLQAVAAALVGVDAIVGIGIEGATGRVQIDLTDVSGAADIEADLRSRLTTSGIPLDTVRIEVASGPVGDSRRGGLVMSTCTTGFSVQNSSGTRGVLTAGHCANSQNYQLYGSSTQYSMTFQSELRSANADLQWHTTAAAEEPRFHADSTSSTRALTSVVARANQGGDQVCSRGRTTGYRCGNVTSISYQPTWADACPGTTCNAVFVRVNAANAGGDSGGPWFFNTLGYGIHKGGSSTFSVYTSTNYFGSLGVAAFYG